MIRVSEDVCCLNKIQTHRSMYFFISESNCFSTKTDNSVHVRATRLYHDNDDKADDETDYRKKISWEPEERPPRPNRQARRPPGTNMSRAEMALT